MLRTTTRRPASPQTRPIGTASEATRGSGRRVRTAWAALALAVVAVVAVPHGAAATGSGSPADPVADAARTPEGDRCFVDLTHRSLLDRDATSEEIATWAGRLADGLAHAEVPRALADGREGRTVELTRTYRSALGRQPDAAGLDHWLAHVASGGSFRQVAAAVHGSPESYARAGGTDEAYVDALYQRLLGRSAEGGARTFWSAEVARLGRTRVAARILATPEARLHRTDSLYPRVLGRSADRAGREYWAGRLTTLDDLRVAVILAASEEAITRAERACDVPSGPPTEHVVVVDWDGFDPDFLELADTPNIDALIARGSASIASTTYHPVSNPSRASLVTGALPRTHGNVAYSFDRATGTARAQERTLHAETIAAALGRQDRTVASVQWYMTQTHGTVYGDPEQLYVQPGGTFGERVDVAIDILNQRPVDSNGTPVTVPQIPALLAVYGSEIDSLVHAEGSVSPDLPAMIAQVDADLGRLVQATRDVGIHDETTFVLTGDHGMTDWDRSALPALLDTLGGTGYRTQVLVPPYLTTPDPATEIVVIPVGDRAADITLLGAADSAEGRAAVAEALDGMVGDLLTEVLDTDDMAAMGASDRHGDFHAIPEPPYGMTILTPPAGEMRAGHASRAEMEVPLIMAGAGICTGAVPDDPNLIDVAPTIAALLGVEPPADADGRDLTEVLVGGGCSSA